MNEWKHVAVILNPQTQLMEVVLRWPLHSPIGPRLEKALSMPKVECRNIPTAAQAIAAASEIDEWLIRQDQGERDAQTASVSYSVKKEEPIMKLESPAAPQPKKPAAPTPVAKPIPPSKPIPNKKRPQGNSMFDF